MKLLVEFESKEEMDVFFAASKAGAIEPAASVYIVNATGQSLGVKMTTKEDEPGAAVVEIHQRGAEGTDPFVPGNALQIV